MDGRKVSYHLKVSSSKKPVIPRKPQEGDMINF